VTPVLVGVALLLAVAVAVLVHAVMVAPSRLRTTTIDAPIANLPTEFDGYTLVVLADIHHSGPGRSRRLERMVTRTNDANADLVVLLGDYGASMKRSRALSAALYEQAFPALGFALRSLRSRDGVVAVLGNHDHYYDGRRVAEWLRSTGAQVLINAHVVVQRAGRRLAIGGVGDALEDSVDPMGGAASRPAGIPLVVLSHNPDGVLALSKDCGAALVLSGHTHGGQIVIPGYGAPVTFTRICGRRTASGWVPNAIAPLYVSKGIGAQWRVRFRCPPEVLVVRLRPADDQQPA
jgi:hypothetical protein